MLAAAVLVSGAGYSQAQGDSQPPIILTFNGDIWAYYELIDQLEQLTFWGYNDPPVLSPDGQWLAYTSTAQFAVEASAANPELAFGDLPTNVWLWHTPTGESRRIADHPVDASLGPDGVRFYRRQPAWAPDGRFLAWAELRSNIGWQLVLYDTATDLSQTIADLPPTFADAGFLGNIPVAWSSDGYIAASIFGFEEEVGGLAMRINIYGRDGTLHFSRVLPEFAAGDTPREWLWVNHNGRQKIAVLYGASGTWYLLDPQVGTMAGGPEKAVMYSAQAVGATWGVSPTLSNGGYNWWVIGPQGLPQQPENFPAVDVSFPSLARTALGPDGMSIARLTDALYIWRGDRVTRVEGTEAAAADPRGAVLWAPAVWWMMPAGIPSGTPVGPSATITPAFPPTGLPPTPAFPPPTAMNPTPIPVCNPQLPTRLAMGQQARVLPGDPNNIRERPGLGSRVLGLIPGGGTFAVTGGPFCADGITWWIVSYNDITGWTAEGQGSTYFVEPLP